MSPSSSTVGNTVDWDFAATVGAKLVRPAPPVTDYTRRPGDRGACGRRAPRRSPVRDVTGLNEGAAVTEARIVDEGEWVRAATESMRVHDRRLPTQVRRAASPRRVTGAQTGAVLAFVSSGILGQYDPFSSARRRATPAAGVPQRDRGRAPAAGRRLPTSGCGCACTRSPTACSSAPIRGWPTTCRSRWRSLTDDAGRTLAQVVAGSASSSGAGARQRQARASRIRRAWSGCCAPCSPSRSARRSTSCWCSARCSRVMPTT